MTASGQSRKSIFLEVPVEVSLSREEGTAQILGAATWTIFIFLTQAASGDGDMLLVFAICSGVLLGAWYLARPMPRFWRLGFLTAVALLLAGMTLPPEVIREWAALVSSWWPWSGEADLVTRQTSAWAHLILFALVSAWLSWWRADLGAWMLLVLLVTLSVGTEGLQLLVDGRYASLGDVGINMLGAGIGFLLFWLTPGRANA